MSCGCCRGLVLLVGMSGCTVGPTYQGPPTSIATSAFAAASDHGATVSDGTLPSRWWALYEDPRLDSLVLRGLEANRDLKVAEANIQIALAVVDQSRAARALTTSLSGGLGYERLGIPTPSAGSFVYDIAGSVAYPADFFGGIRRGIEASGYQSDAAIAARDETRVVVAAAITRSYIDICSANRSYAAAGRVLDTQKSTLDTTRRLFAGGRATAFDVTRARGAVDQSAAALPTFVAARRSALYQLGALLGNAPEDYPRDVEACDTPPAPKQLMPIGNGDAFLRRRPDIREAERHLAAATATIGVDIAKLYPEVTFGGSASSAAPFSLAASEASLAFNLGPLVTWSFPNQRVIRAEIKQANAAADGAAAKYEATVIEALRQTETTLTAYVNQIDNVAALQRAQEDTADAVVQAHRLYQFGRIDFINVLTADAASASAESALAQSKALLADNQVAVFLALGGGWALEDRLRK